MSSRTVTAREARSPSTSPSSTSALVAISVAVSNARISIAADGDKPASFPAVLQSNPNAWRRQDTLPRLRPFDEDDGVVEVRLEVAPLGRGHALEAKEVEMGDVDFAAIAVTDGERGARHRALDTQRATRPTNEGRLPGAELTRDGHDVTGFQLGRQAGSDLLRLGRGVRLDQNRPSCTAGSAVTGAT